MRAQDLAGCSLALQARCILLTWDRQEDRNDGIPSFCRMHPTREGAESGSVHHPPNIKLPSKDRETTENWKVLCKIWDFLRQL